MRQRMIFCAPAAPVLPLARGARLWHHPPVGDLEAIMILRNCIIIYDDEPIQMEIEELRNCTGNRVFSRTAIPADVLSALERRS